MVHDYQIPVPRQWTSCVKSAFLHTISLASATFTITIALAAKRKATVTRLKAELADAYKEIGLLQEELAIKDERFQRVQSHRRPYYTPVQRLQIMKLRAARRWTVVQTAKVFHLTPLTIISWMRRLDEEGEHALLQLPERVNRFPDFVRYIVRQLKVYFPGLGKVKIAQILSRAGLHMGVTTVGRILKEDSSKTDDGKAVVLEEEPLKVRVVTAKYPGHLYHCDLTVIPTAAGFWVSWWPFTMFQRWPFAWWVGVVIDHFSRQVMGYAVFAGKPSSRDVRSFLGRVFKKSGMKPRHIITDRDSIFDCPAFVKWCRRRGIWPRYGAVGKYGSVSVIERFIRNMKSEGTRRVRVPLSLDAMRRELLYYVNWYNQHRPHTGLMGETPAEVFQGKKPANRKPRFEPRSRWPRGSPCAMPQTKVKGKAGAELVLVIGFYAGRKHLPVVELKRVA